MSLTAYSKTCRTRKIKCDETLPVCARCRKQKLFCDRSLSLPIKQFKGTIQHDELIPSNSPAVLLKNSTVARLFHIYIKELAPWYDLNDSTCSSFGTKAPMIALESPLLFVAIIAFAGTYAFRKYKTPHAVAESYHNRCLHLLISLSPNDDAVKNGVALAATCLLRSYEILSEKEDPNRHLFGASTLLPPTPDMCDRSLVACGFWNYLREDITYSLVYECPLKIQVPIPSEQPKSDDDHANCMTLFLGALVNSYFGNTSIDIAPSIEQWRSNFQASSFSRCEEGPFPMVRMLRDCHVAALHYFNVAQCMLKPETRVSSAIEICGLAMASESDAVIVNAYGPVYFAGKYILDGTQRQTLVFWLKSTQKTTAWPVNVLISKLERAWSGSIDT